MISIQKGISSYIYITLTDKRLTSSNTYTFKFVNDTTNEQILLNLNDVSTYKNRYSKFQILNTSFQNSTIGFWRYYVTQTGSGNTIIATGKFNLTDSNLSNTEIVRYGGYDGSYKTYTL